MAVQKDTHQADRLVARVADAQHGVVARRQLTDRGIGRGWIEERLRRGMLVQLHRGVYAVGHRRLHANGFRMAATLAAGPGAALSHRDAAALHALRPASNRMRIEVTTTAKAASTPKLQVYARRVLTVADVAVLDAIPVTTVERTLVDLADVIPRHQLAAALSAAERLRITDLFALEAAVDRVHGRRGPGQANLRAVVAEHAKHGAQLTRSDLEERFLALVTRARLPAPQMNARIEDREVDAVWHAERVAVELDGWTFHGGRVAFGRDRRKGNWLTLAGWQPLRYTHDDLVSDSARVERELRAALGRR